MSVVTSNFCYQKLYFLQRQKRSQLLKAQICMNSMQLYRKVIKIAARLARYLALVSPASTCKFPKNKQ